VGVDLKETDGWNLIGVFPMLDVCPRVTGEEENGRTAALNLRAEVRGIISLVNPPTNLKQRCSVTGSVHKSEAEASFPSCCAWLYG
jgi:hypothetical protein